MSNNTKFSYHRRKRLNDLLDSIEDQSLVVEIRDLIRVSSMTDYRERKFRQKIRDLQIKIRDLETI